MQEKNEITNDQVNDLNTKFLNLFTKDGNSQIHIPMEKFHDFCFANYPHILRNVIDYFKHVRTKEERKRYVQTKEQDYKQQPDQLQIFTLLIFVEEMKIREKLALEKLTPTDAKALSSVALECDVGWLAAFQRIIAEYNVSDFLYGSGVGQRGLLDAIEIIGIRQFKIGWLRLIFLKKLRVN